jgi:Cys-tRNA(Pro)/Cys-tRNA(Cys) deacylase
VTAKSAPKTNACRVLDRLGIGYELRSYDFDPDELQAERVAEKIGLPSEQVFKTLCVRADDRSTCYAVIPGNYELDLKRLAQVAGHRSLSPVAVKELQELTGYIRGGVTALASKKSLPVFADEMMLLFEVISVSAGQRGLQILIAPEDYVLATGATVAEISREKASA